MNQEAPVLALDGPSGSGKGTIARRVAEALDWHLLDSGALYRLAGLAAVRADIALDAEAELAELAASLDIRFNSDAAGDERIWLENEDVTALIRTEEGGRLASAIAPLPASGRHSWACNGASASRLDWSLTAAIWGLRFSPMRRSRCS